VQTIVERPAALDVHKAQVTACARVPDGRDRREQHIAEFPTTVRGLLDLRDWLAGHGARIPGPTRDSTSGLSQEPSALAVHAGICAGGGPSPQAKACPYRNHAIVAWRAAGVISRQRRRRATPPGRVEP
jgi:hypothetical protein